MLTAHKDKDKELQYPNKQKTINSYKIKHAYKLLETHIKNIYPSLLKRKNKMSHKSSRQFSLIFYNTQTSKTQ